MDLKYHNKKHLVILLGLVIAISGCTQGQQLANGPGITILTFEPDINFIESLDDIQLRFEIQNAGGEEAKDVTARLIGISPDEWNFQEEIFLGDMLPANPNYGTEGAKKSDFFLVIAPLLPESQKTTYNPILRVHYGYRTTATKQITLVTQEDLRRIQTGKGIPLNSGPTVSSGGPFSVSITTGNVIRATRDFGDVKAFPLSIRITNTGQGSLSPNPVNPLTGEEDTMLLKAELPPGLDFETPECDALIGGDIVPLFRGQSADITCEVIITNPPTSIEQRTILLILEYDYFLDRSTTLTVKGTETGEVF